ncbi:intradiol ring-cleavage dioxygenase [Actinoplanes sp. NPDC049599]|uniref:dioxygenase family protein n=1 Tax=Actinoplanes sp. NPDC049599 TaxID=3363903 RepID=UPI0037B22863
MTGQPDEIPADNDAYVREVHDKGLRFDLRTMSRRRMLTALGGAGVLTAVGGRLLTDQTPAAAACVAEVESETAGPYPADGSNGVEIRTVSGVVRSDIRSSFGGATGVAGGIGLTFSLTVLKLSCAPLVGAAVYAWHCDREGRYSLYSSGVTNQNYLRGIQATDSTGTVTFSSVYPGCYAGRWPHIHFEVYASLADATSGRGPIVKTSQIALPKATSSAVYATVGYSQSVTNLSRITLATDNVFRDDLAAREMATVTGNVTTGYHAGLTISVKG